MVYYNETAEAFPTSVGMNRYNRTHVAKLYGVPHKRGDEPVYPLPQIDAH